MKVPLSLAALSLAAAIPAHAETPSQAALCIQEALTDSPNSPPLIKRSSRGKETISVKGEENGVHLAGLFKLRGAKLRLQTTSLSFSLDEGAPFRMSVRQKKPGQITMRFSQATEESEEGAVLISLGLLAHKGMRQAVAECLPGQSAPATP